MFSIVVLEYAPQDPVVKLRNIWFHLNSTFHIPVNDYNQNKNKGLTKIGPNR